MSWHPIEFNIKESTYLHGPDVIGQSRRSFCGPPFPLWQKVYFSTDRRNIEQLPGPGQLMARSQLRSLLSEYDAWGVSDSLTAPTRHNKRRRSSFLPPRWPLTKLHPAAAATIAGEDVGIFFYLGTSPCRRIASARQVRLYIFLAVSSVPRRTTHGVGRSRSRSPGRQSKLADVAPLSWYISWPLPPRAVIFFHFVFILRLLLNSKSLPFSAFSSSWSGLWIRLGLLRRAGFFL